MNSKIVKYENRSMGDESSLLVIKPESSPYSYRGHIVTVTDEYFYNTITPLTRGGLISITFEELEEDIQAEVLLTLPRKPRLVSIYD